MHLKQPGFKELADSLCPCKVMWHLIPVYICAKNSHVVCSLAVVHLY